MYILFLSAFFSLKELSCCGRTMAPKHAHVQIPRTYKRVNLHGKKDFPAVIKLRIFRLSWILWVRPQGCLQVQEGGTREVDVRMEAEVSAITAALKMAGRPQAKECGQPLEAGKGKNLRKRMKPYQHLEFSP